MARQLAQAGRLQGLDRVQSEVELRENAGAPVYHLGWEEGYPDRIPAAGGRVEAFALTNRQIEFATLPTESARQSHGGLRRTCENFPNSCQDHRNHIDGKPLVMRG